MIYIRKRSTRFPIITIFFYRLVSVLAIYNLLAIARKHSLVFA